jgi:hypothetical protein
VSAGSDQTVNLADGAMLSASVSDDGLPVGSISVWWSLYSGPGEVSFGSPNSLRTTARFPVAGTYVVRVVASDSELISDSTATITVVGNVDQNQTNQAPSVYAGPSQTVPQSSGATLSASVTDDGLPNGSLVVSWRQLSGPGSVTFSAPSSPNTSAAFSQPGTYVLQVFATDSELFSDSATTITVLSFDNHAPSVNAGPDQSVSFPSAAIVSATTSDDGLPNGSVSVFWSLVSGPGMTTFESPASATTAVTFSEGGTYVLRATVSDGALDASDDVVVTVTTAGNAGSGSPAGAPTVDTWPPRKIAFPAKDLTLFGHASDSSGSPLQIRWVQTSGPAAATFSAPWALTTTVSFTTPGLYGFDLVVSNGSATASSSTTVQVFAESSQTAFYVDPTYNGLLTDGSASRPWRSLDLLVGSVQWALINLALASNNVVVYFSARQAGSDTPEAIDGEVNIWRADKSSNRLTLDGMSKYNANDSSGNWLPNTGSSRFKFALSSRRSVAIGVQSNNLAFPMDNTTIRGFEITGPGGRVLIAGNDVTVEHIYSHDISEMGPTVFLHNAVNADCTPAFGNLTGITFRNNTIVNGMGEAFYVGGNYQDPVSGGCPPWGNSHSDILLEGNVIVNPGLNGEQGDAIDLKAGLKNVTVRKNTIMGVPHGIGAYAIVSQGTFDYQSVSAGYLIEQNTILDGQATLFIYQNGTIIRNNVFRNGLIYFSGNERDKNYNITVESNTLYGQSSMYPNNGGLAFGGVEGAVVKNNLIAGITSDQIQIYLNDCNGIVSGYNLLVSGAAIDYRYPLGSGDRLMSQGTSYFVDASSNDFHLNSSSPAINAGIDLTSSGFWSDLDGVTRTQNGVWDVGAYKFR